MKSRREIWKDIHEYEGYYQVSNIGRVRSLDRKTRHREGMLRNVRGRNIKTCPNKLGYLYVLLTKNGNRASKSVHRLVAEAFIKNPKKYPEVNHINEQKADNRVGNLEWCTGQQNTEHSTAKHFRFISPEGRVIDIFNLSKFCRETGLDKSYMSALYHGKCKSAYGWTSLKGCPQED